MWCRNCEQDVPVVAVREAVETVCCARCHQPLAPSCTAPAGASDREGPTGVEVGARYDRPWTDADAWQLEDELSQARRLAATIPGLSVSREPLESRAAERRWDRSPGELPPAGSRLALPPHAAGVPRDPDEPSETARSPLPSPTTPGRLRQIGPIVSWLSLMLGAALLAFGGVVSTSSVFSQRSDLWTLGWPTLLVGQLLLLVGLLSQFEGLLQTNRRQHLILRHLDRELRALHSPAPQNET